jgi:hypothetical protein
MEFPGKSNGYFTFAADRAAKYTFTGTLKGYPCANRIVGIRP